MKILSIKQLYSQTGVTAVIVAIVLTTLVGLSAIVIDLGYLYAERNRLQNAVDAGALAGARKLYVNDGKSISSISDITTAVLDIAQTKNVPAGTFNPIDKGHYSFGLGNITRGFQANNDDSIKPVDLWNVSDIQLDENTNNINSVSVVATLTAPSFFSKLWNYTGFNLSVDAVAYIGFAGIVEPYELDEPIAMCQQSIIIDEKFTCSVGRMLNNGTQTAAWTNFEQPCSGAADAQDVWKDILTPCPTKGANVNPLSLGEPVTLTNGTVDKTLDTLYNCWLNGKNEVPPDQYVDIDTDKDGKPDIPWKLTLPVIDCSVSHPNCKPTKGIVEIGIVWILDKEKDDSPYKMGAWSSSNTNDATRWQEFVSYFKLVDSKGKPAAKEKKTIYYLPDCTQHEPTGTTGGNNYGVRAKIPVLVE